MSGIFTSSTDAAASLRAELLDIRSGLRASAALHKAVTEEHDEAWLELLEAIVKDFERPLARVETFLRDHEY